MSFPWFFHGFPPFSTAFSTCFPCEVPLPGFPAPRHLPRRGAFLELSQLDAGLPGGGVWDHGGRDFRRFHGVSVGILLGFYGILWDVIGFYWMLLDLIGFYWILLDFIMDDDDFLDDDSLGFHHSTHDPTP